MRLVTSVSLFIGLVIGQTRPRKRSTRRLLTDIDLLREEFTNAIPEGMFAQVLRSNRSPVVQTVGDAQRLVFPISIYAACYSLVDTSDIPLAADCVNAIVGLVWSWKRTMEAHVTTAENAIEGSVAAKLFVEAATRQLIAEQMSAAEAAFSGIKRNLLGLRSSSWTLLQELEVEKAGMNARLVEFLKLSIQRVTDNRREREMRRSGDQDETFQLARMLFTMGEAKSKWIYLVALELLNRPEFETVKPVNSFQEVLASYPYLEAEKSNFPDVCVQFAFDEVEFITTCPEVLNPYMEKMAEEPTVISSFRRILYGLSVEHERMLRAMFAISWNNPQWVYDRIQTWDIAHVIRTLVSRKYSVDPFSLPVSCMRSMALSRGCAWDLATHVSEHVNERVRFEWIRDAEILNLTPIFSVIAACFPMTNSHVYGFDRIRRSDDFLPEHVYPSLTSDDLKSDDPSLFDRAVAFFNSPNLDQQSELLFLQLAPALWRSPELFFARPLQNGAQYALFGRLLAAALRDPEISAHEHSKVFSPFVLDAVLAPASDPMPAWLHAVREGFRAGPPVQGAMDGWTMASELAGIEDRGREQDRHPAGVRRVAMWMSETHVTGRVVKIKQDEVEEVMMAFVKNGNKFAEMGVQPKFVYHMNDEDEDEDEDENEGEIDDTEDVLRTVIMRLMNESFGLFMRRAENGKLDLIEYDKNNNPLIHEYVILLIRTLNLAGELGIALPEMLDVDDNFIQKLKTTYMQYFSFDINNMEPTQITDRLAIEPI
jgi:hypothetical protein